jgi:hypothetical protein
LKAARAATKGARVFFGQFPPLAAWAVEELVALLAVGEAFRDRIPIQRFAELADLPYNVDDMPD